MEGPVMILYFLLVRMSTGQTTDCVCSETDRRTSCFGLPVGDFACNIVGSLVCPPAPAGRTRFQCLTWVPIELTNGGISIFGAEVCSEIVPVGSAAAGRIRRQAVSGVTWELANTVCEEDLAAFLFNPNIMFDSIETSGYFLNFDQPLSKLLTGREIGDIIEATDNILFTEIFNNILPFGQKWWVDAERFMNDIFKYTPVDSSSLMLSQKTTISSTTPRDCLTITGSGTEGDPIIEGEDCQTELLPVCVRNVPFEVERQNCTCTTSTGCSFIAQNCDEVSRLADETCHDGSYAEPADCYFISGVPASRRKSKSLRKDMEQSKNKIILEVRERQSKSLDEDDDESNLIGTGLYPTNENKQVVKESMDSVFHESDNNILNNVTNSKFFGVFNSTFSRVINCTIIGVVNSRISDAENCTISYITNSTMNGIVKSSIRTAKNITLDKITKSTITGISNMNYTNMTNSIIDGNYTRRSNPQLTRSGILSRQARQESEPEPLADYCLTIPPIVGLCLALGICSPPFTPPAVPPPPPPAPVAPPAPVPRPPINLNTIQDFATFQTQFAKTYPTLAETLLRQEIFQNNLQIINSHNTLYSRGDSSYFLRVNTFADQTLEEVSVTYSGLGRLGVEQGSLNRAQRRGTNRNYYSPPLGDRRKYYAPSSVNWLAAGAVTDVRFQLCNSCAAHAVTAALETCLWRSSGGVLPPQLSVQQLSECTDGRITDQGQELERGNLYCESGWPGIHLEYLLSEQGGRLGLSRDNPEVGAEGERGDCQQTHPGIFGSVRSFEEKFFSTEEDLELAVGQVGPSITNIDVTPHMVFYGGGVYYNSTQCSNYASEPVPNECLGDGGEGFSCLTRGEIKCSELLPDHCDRFFVPSEKSFPHSITVVGYDQDPEMGDFWLIKNSWGTDWGEAGFMRLTKGLGHCGAGSYYLVPEC